MGYFVDGVCVSTKEQAEAMLYSKVAPVITENGVKQLDYINGQYVFESQVLTSVFPECSQAANFIQGAQFGLYIGLFFAAAYGFIAMKRAM
ncbi:hypothetical protein LVJ82_17725 [Vitreoscilla massiliensis]|uniref:Uncharacterized protein n=1 Tax=Vitreoscilla massiliensis TaxID=1689272 RepID=A0ABY4E0E3_9NEIS|nr:hypothetical protein [Vitreoscilla massiliensis]UOO89257.1 hypothetical protein LVJ82_17725 [Vitreoscilla massiliensis]